MKLFILIVPFLFLSSQGEKMTNERQQDCLSGWNSATIKSIESQRDACRDSAQRSIYENRLKAFLVYEEINGTVISKTSPRYRFLRRISEEQIAAKWYVVETATSGETIELRNYLIQLLPNSRAKVTSYFYVMGKWTQEHERSIKWTDGGALLTHSSKFGEGINSEDVIITRFASDSVSESYFFLYSTLAKGNNFTLAIGRH